MTVTPRGCDWLEVVPGRAPLLLIAPHGGRAGARGRAKLHPKVNDLETAEITRELAARLKASAIINHGMDRNELDCNRLSQLIEREPWLLAMIADQVEQTIGRHGRITVLLIHGWNIIEPRVDLGVGGKLLRNQLQAPRGAHLSASDEFIKGVVHSLTSNLEVAGITATFGLRYPGAGAQNLLQAFTPRYADSEHDALRRIAAAAVEGRIDALQLELSVALRLPGPLRDQATDAISDVFTAGIPKIDRTGGIEVVRTTRPAVPRRSKPELPIPPVRIGVEFYDPQLRIGGIASFDFGPNAAGGRIMMLAKRRRVALFTGEGGAVRHRNSVSLGTLALDTNPQNGGLRFRGPAVAVEDGAAYLNVENALAQARIDPLMEIDTALELNHDGPDFGELLARFEEQVRNGGPKFDLTAESIFPQASFGRISGRICFSGRDYELDGIARVGVSFTGLGPRTFVTRRMLWASACDRSGYQAVELKALELDDGQKPRTGFIRDGEGWSSGVIENLVLQNDSPHSPPDEIRVSVGTGAETISIIGTPETFMSLSRPGLDGSRIRTSLGFASYAINGKPAAGMYEYSIRSGPASSADPDTDEQ